MSSAENEVIDLFINGISPKIEKKIKNILLDKLQKREANKIIKEIDEFSEDIYRNQIRSMLPFLPKKELAVLSEKIIRLECIHCKYSKREDSVGEPIDVVLITKQDGFKWVKRKH